MELFLLIISLSSLAISFFVAFNNFWYSRKNINITQTHNASRSIFLKSYDGSSASYDYSYPLDSSPQIASLGLVEIVITNNSSLPISILEFSIPGLADFSSYSPTVDFFTVTTRKSSKTIMGDNNSPLNYLKPEFTLNPYTSKRGYLLFWSGQECDMPIEENIPLTILTSRGSFNKNIKFSDSIESIKKHVHYSSDDEGNQTSTYT